MTRSGRALERVEAELAAERAAALGRAGERLEAPLQEAAALAERVRTASDPAVRRDLLAQYEEARRSARGARLALTIQREALGLRRHAVVNQQYPEPPGLGVPR